MYMHGEYGYTSLFAEPPQALFKKQEIVYSQIPLEKY